MTQTEAEFLAKVRPAHQALQEQAALFIDCIDKHRLTNFYPNVHSVVQPLQQVIDEPIERLPENLEQLDTLFAKLNEESEDDFGVNLSELMRYQDHDFAEIVTCMTRFAEAMMHLHQSISENLN